MIDSKHTTDEYVRDGRAPVPINENISKVMSANKARGTKPELILRKILWSAGLKGYRLNSKNIPGRPDIVYHSKKLAIFINGCFWHRCPKCDLPLPKTNRDFWKNKFDANIERDKQKTLELERLGWKVKVVWECQLKNELDKITQDIRLTLLK